MHSSSPPPAPNPASLIQQASQSNQTTAARNFQNSLVNQSTPYGSLGYTQDPKTKRWTATQKLTPEQQSLLDQNQKFGGSMNEAGQSYADFINGQDPNFDLSSTAIDKTIMDRYQPRFDENRAAEMRNLEQSLSNKGFSAGDTGYDDAIRRFNLTSNDSYTDLQMKARNQAISEMLQQRNQPFNELNSIYGMMGKPQGMSFVNTPQYSEPFIDTAGITQQGYQNQMNAYNQQQANSNAMMSGLFSIGGTVLGGALGGPIGAGIGSRVGGWVGPGGTGPGL
jgi:hypothetical protein